MRRSRQGFEPSYVALARLPAGRQLHGGQPRVDAELGQAFTADREAVLASIQRLRAKSQEAGNLKSTPQQTVETQRRRAASR